MGVRVHNVVGSTGFVSLEMVSPCDFPCRGRMNRVQACFWLGTTSDDLTVSPDQNA
jgi:hypothetical protein